MILKMGNDMRYPILFHFLAHRDSTIVRILWGMPGFRFTGDDRRTGLLRVMFDPFSKQRRGW
jgi:hypothetical protein